MDSTPVCTWVLAPVTVVTTLPWFSIALFIGTLKGKEFIELIFVWAV
jgi:hypothetical protein